jgi:hypothetical protein
MPLRYAILHHTGVAEPHFDLMFETFEGSDLATWRSPVWPVHGVTPVVRLTDHRRAYLEFQGEITRKRGWVERVAGGACAVEVGPQGQWTIRFLTGTQPGTLGIADRGVDDWEATDGPVAPASSTDPF